MSTSKRRPGKVTEAERDLIDGLEEFHDALAADEKIADRFTCRKVVLDLRPQAYGAAQVKVTRKQLHLSQVLFAQLLGVSANTVRAWESGKTPSDMACRFMDEIQCNPEYWRKRVKKAMRSKSC
jgi:DNA-binding transcriptional regulator YiaG